MDEFNQFMKDTNNLDKPSTLNKLNQVLSNLTGMPLLFSLSYIYKVVDLSNRYMLQDLLKKHKQRLEIINE